MGREPGEGMMRELEGRAGTFKAQDVAISLWSAGVIALLCAPGQVICNSIITYIINILFYICSTIITYISNLVQYL